MKLLSIISIIFIISFIYISSKAQQRNISEDCNIELKNKYINNLILKYKDYNIEVDSQVKRPIGFIGFYLAMCERDPTINFESLYEIINTCNLDADTGTHERLLYSEFIYFKNSATMDSIIFKIQKINCPFPYDLKLNKIYIIGTNEALFVNFYPTFDVPDFEKFLLSEFGCNISIKTLNAPDTRYSAEPPEH